MRRNRTHQQARHERTVSDELDYVINTAGYRQRDQWTALKDAVLAHHGKYEGEAIMLLLNYRSLTHQHNVIKAYKGITGQPVIPQHLMALLIELSDALLDDDSQSGGTEPNDPQTPPRLSDEEFFASGTPQGFNRLVKAHDIQPVAVQFWSKLRDLLREHHGATDGTSISIAMTEAYYRHELDIFDSYYFATEVAVPEYLLPMFEEFEADNPE